MNSRGIYNRHPLKECRVCGMDAGMRMVTEELPERFYVVCEVCAFKTRAHKSQGAATKEWNGDAVQKGEKR